MRYFALICTVLASPLAMACATCSGPADAAQSQGMNAAILTLFCIMGIVALTVIAFVTAIALVISPKKVPVRRFNPKTWQVQHHELLSLLLLPCAGLGPRRRH